MDPTQAAAPPAVGLQVRPVQEEGALDRGQRLRYGSAMLNDVAPLAPTGATGASDGSRAAPAAAWRSTWPPAKGPQGAGRSRSPSRPPKVTRRQRPRKVGGRFARGALPRGGRRRRGAPGAGQRDFRCAKCGRSFRHTHLTIRVRNGPPGERPGRRAAASAFSSFSKPLGRRASASEKPYRCARCGKAFGRVSRLAAHRRAHAGERLHGCGECGKAFRSRAALAGHEKTHAGLGPFECGVCEKTFLRKAHLAQHQRAHAE
ncbi:zinc finger protein 696-like [Erinaceus europaeus]|uniref:Zinc finger protein 696-like n=1 Tax=Erinaceus europaeus TaxID=9365 RepID=A0ABM3W7E9_ERIEU|nr:zinc finger protein 696-like [Erinaceus europaeus]